MRGTGLLAAAVALSGCALKGDVRRVERELLDWRSAAARGDSARAAEVGRQVQEVLGALAALGDSLAALQTRQLGMHADVRTDLTEIQRQLVQIQELTGQSQQRLTELRQQIQERQRAPLVTAAPNASPTDSARGGVPVEGLPPPDELFSLSLSQLRRGSPGTARTGFVQFLRAYPDHERAPDAQFFIGESWQGADDDSAAVAYEAVVRDYPNSRHAPNALFKLALLADRRGDAAAARVFLERILAGYPRSEEAALARDRLNRR